MNRSRVSLCVFMLVVLSNPLALFFGSNSTIANNSGGLNATIHEHHGHVLGGRATPILLPVGSSTDDRGCCDSHKDGGGRIAAGGGVWWQWALTRNALFWLINATIVFLILCRLLIWDEPIIIADRPAWLTFLRIRDQALNAIGACNYREAQRRLSEALDVR